MGRITKNLKELIDRGRKGENHALSMGLPKLERFVDGVAQETYYLIAGGTGSGKTSFALHSFIYKPIMENIDNPDFHIIYFSLEMTAEQLLGKILSIYRLIDE
jgi:replicative DNA helicase